jgi:flagellin-like protein
MRMKVTLRDISIFLFGGCAITLLLAGAMFMYGDLTATRFSVFATSAYFAVCSLMIYVYDCAFSKKTEDEAVNLLEGLSPIVCTLLLLALTVVFAVAVAAMAMGMTDVTPKSFTAHQEGEWIYVTYMGGPSQLNVADPGIVATVNEQPMSTPFPTTGHIAVGTSAKTLGTPGKDHVVVTVVFKDARSIVMLDTWV